MVGPTGNILPFMKRQRGQRVVDPVGVGIEGAFLIKPKTKVQPVSFDAGEDPRTNPLARQRLAEKHIGIIRQILQNKTPPRDLNEKEIADVVSAVQHTIDPNPQTVVQTVLSAANDALPKNAQSDLDDFLKKHNMSKEEYFAALAKVGAGLSPEQVMAAARNMRSGAGNDASSFSSNMSQGVGNSEYKGNLGGISMSNYIYEGREFRATGMTYGTFAALRAVTLSDGSKLSGENIIYGARASNDHALGGANNIRATKAWSTLHKLDPNVAEFEGQGTEYDKRLKADPDFQKAIKALVGAATEEQRAKALAEIDVIKEKYADPMKSHVGKLEQPDAKKAGAIAIQEQQKRTINEAIRAEFKAHPELSDTAKTEIIAKAMAAVEAQKIAKAPVATEPQEKITPKAVSELDDFGGADTTKADAIVKPVKQAEIVPVKDDGKADLKKVSVAEADTKKTPEPPKSKPATLKA